MVDVFISYPQRERVLMLPLKARLEALGLILFVDVDGRLDSEPNFPQALDNGVRAAKAVLGVWSPWALSRQWVQNECAIGKDENKLVAVERLPIKPAQVPALFYLVDRKPLTDFDGKAPHEGWAMTLSALATKMKLWLEARPDHPEAADVRVKTAMLERAAAAELAALGVAPLGPGSSYHLTPTVPPRQQFEVAWETIENSLETSHYKKYERAFEREPQAFLKVLEAEARAKALARWAATDQCNPDAVAEVMRTGLFPALQAVAEQALAAAEAKARAKREAVERARAETEAKALAAAEAEARTEREAVKRARAEAEGKARDDAEAAERVWAEANRRFKPVRVLMRDGRQDRNLRLSPKETFTDYWLDARGKVVQGPKMVVIPPGTFLMGSSPQQQAEALAKSKAGGEEINREYFVREGPQRAVTIPSAFALGVYAVTFDEWDAFARERGIVDANDKNYIHDWFGRGREPVINVSWDDAQDYIRWLNEKTGQCYRLPSEAEWEYACRADTTTQFWWGDSISPGQANYNATLAFSGPKDKFLGKTLSVECFVPNPWGLYQMHGNVAEWCQDCDGDYKEAPMDGAAQESDSCTNRVLRGGSWNCGPGSIRAAFRNSFSVAEKADIGAIGFRLARTLVPPGS